jgi:hypothetical protein
MEKNNNLSRIDGSTICKEVIQDGQQPTRQPNLAVAARANLFRDTTLLDTCYLVSYSGRKLLEPPIRVSIVQRVAITIRQLTFNLMAGQRPSTVRLLPRYRGQPAPVCWMLPRPSRSWARNCRNPVTISAIRRDSYLFSDT